MIIIYNAYEFVFSIVLAKIKDFLEFLRYV